MTDWVVPKTIGAEPSALGLWNTYLADNMAALKAPATNKFNAAYAAAGTTYVTASTSFVDIHADFSLSITTFGGDILCCFVGNFLISAFLDIAFDGVRQGGNDGILACGYTEFAFPLYWLLTDVAAGIHTIKPQWKTGSSATLSDLYPAQWWVREVS